MKHLFLLRHAKSSWDDDGLADFDRPLSPRGKRATRSLARHIRTRDLGADLVLCSAAARAAETWRRISRQLACEAPVVFERELYLAGAAALLGRLTRLDDADRTVVLVGHNPDLETLAAMLCRSAVGDALDRLQSKYPTGGLAEIEFDCAHWREIAARPGILLSFVVPRALPDPPE